jgi:hypothetical protein
VGKRIHHMGMTLTNEEHERWHKQSQDLPPKQHDALMKKLGVTKEQDEEWHRTHQTLSEQRPRGTKAVNPFAVGGGFLVWCTEQGWLVKRGKQYVATPEGIRELHKRFGIEV